MKRRKSLPEKKEPEKQQIEVSSNLITNVQKETNLENPQINYYLEQFLKQDFSAYIKQKQIEENQIKKLEKTPPPKKSPSVLISSAEKGFNEAFPFNNEPEDFFFDLNNDLNDLNDENFNFDNINNNIPQETMDKFNSMTNGLTFDYTTDYTGLGFIKNEDNEMTRY